MARKVYIRWHAIDNGIDDYQVVVKPSDPNNPLGVNKFGILDKQEAIDYAADLGKRFGCEPEDQTLN